MTIRVDGRVMKDDGIFQEPASHCNPRPQSRIDRNHRPLASEYYVSTDERSSPAKTNSRTKGSRRMNAAQVHVDVDKSRPRINDPDAAVHQCLEPLRIMPGPLGFPSTRPRRKTTPRSYSLRILIAENRYTATINTATRTLGSGISFTMSNAGTMS